MAKIGFIGMGNMGYAILKGLLAYIPKEEVTFSEVNRERRLWAEEQTGVCAAESGKDCAEKSKYLILAVKPQYMDQVMEELAPVIKKEQIIISIAAGIDTRYLKGKLGEDKRIVRSMPNTPALVGEGMSGVCMEESQFTEEEKLEIGKIFNSFGKMKIVPEKLIDAAAVLRLMYICLLKRWQTEQSNMDSQEKMLMRWQLRQFSEAQRWCWRQGCIQAN